ncbi:MAG: hypothetical protein V4736_05000 [Bdellovibrionota bacterium]
MKSLLLVITILIGQATWAKAKPNRIQCGQNAGAGRATIFIDEIGMLKNGNITYNYSSADVVCENQIDPMEAMLKGATLNCAGVWGFDLSVGNNETTSVANIKLQERYGVIQGIFVTSGDYGKKKITMTCKFLTAEDEI